MRNGMKLVLAALVLAFVSCAHAPLHAAEPTLWGGDHVQMQVTEDGATLDFDCAHGAITEPLRIAKDGTFLATGTYGAEHAGPTRRDEPADPKATFSGTVVGDAMTLRVVIDGQDPAGLRFQLVRNQPGKVRKCR